MFSRIPDIKGVFFCGIVKNVAFSVSFSLKVLLFFVFDLANWVNVGKIKFK